MPPNTEKLHTTPPEGSEGVLPLPKHDGVNAYFSTQKPSRGGQIGAFANVSAMTLASTVFFIIFMLVSPNAFADSWLLIGIVLFWRSGARFCSRRSGHACG